MSSATVTTRRPVKHLQTPRRRPENLQARLIDVESDLFSASTEAVYQRNDLAEAATDENNRLLEAALGVEGLPPLAREYIERALAIERGEDAAVRRAERRREVFHGYTRSAGGRVDGLITGRDLADFIGQKLGIDFDGDAPCDLLEQP